MTSSTRLRLIRLLISGPISPLLLSDPVKALEYYATSRVDVRRRAPTTPWSHDAVPEQPRKWTGSGAFIVPRPSGDSVKSSVKPFTSPMMKHKRVQMENVSHTCPIVPPNIQPCGCYISRVASLCDPSTTPWKACAGPFLPGGERKRFR